MKLLSKHYFKVPIIKDHNKTVPHLQEFQQYSTPFFVFFLNGTPSTVVLTKPPNLYMFWQNCIWFTSVLTKPDIIYNNFSDKICDPSTVSDKTVPKLYFIYKTSVFWQNATLQEIQHYKTDFYFSVFFLTISIFYTVIPHYSDHFLTKRKKIWLERFPN